MTGECPHDRDIESCDAASYDEASKCPSVNSPHALADGDIARTLRQGWPMKSVGNCANVSETVLSMHYDSHTEREK